MLLGNFFPIVFLSLLSFFSLKCWLPPQTSALFLFIYNTFFSLTEHSVFLVTKSSPILCGPRRAFRGGGYVSDGSTLQSMPMQSPRREAEKRTAWCIETGEKPQRGVCVCVCVCLQTNLWKYIYAFMLSVMCLLGKVNNYSSVLVPRKQDLVSKLGKFQANKDALVTLPLGHDGTAGGVGGWGAGGNRPVALLLFSLNNLYRLQGAPVVALT